MSNFYRMLRSTVFGNRPAVGTRPSGNPYVNLAEKQFGVVDTAQAPQDLIGVPFFSTGANYNPGQPVNYQGQVYVALTTVTAGVWNAAQWTPLASQAWAVGQGGLAGGSLNKLRNPRFAVWQRGSSFAVAPAAAGQYTSDGWIVVAVGATANISVGTGRFQPQSLGVAGAAGLTNFNLVNRMEAQDVWGLGGGNATFQMQIYNNTGSPFSPTVALGHASARNNFSTVVNDGSVVCQSCPNGAWTRIACTFAVPAASAQNGLQISVSPGAVTSGNILFSEADFRATPGVSIGINNNPPPSEFLMYTLDLIRNIRNYWDPKLNIQLSGYAPSAGIPLGILITTYPCGAMFGTPTATPTFQNVSNLTNQNVAASNTYAIFSGNAVAAGPWFAQLTGLQLSAEL